MKYIFKQAIKPLVPESILTRKKQGFGLPIRHWLNHELKEKLNETLSESSLKNRGLFDPKEVSRIVERDAAQEIDATFLLFSMMAIEMWCREFVDLAGHSTVQSKVRTVAFPL